MYKISKNEWKFIIIISIIIILITTIPYLYGYFNAPDGYSYNGLHSLTTGDIPVYYSYINQSIDGSFLFENNFSHELQETKTLNIFWLVVGKVANVFNINAILALHIFRVLLIPFGIVSIYIFISYFFQEIKKRKLSTIFTLFSSGLGAYILPFILQNKNLNISNTQLWPIDFWVPESNTFLTLYHMPHLILSLSLMLLVYYLILNSIDNKKYLYALYAGLLGLIWFNFHPYYFISTNAIIGTYLIIRLIQNKKELLHLVSIYLLWFIPSTLSVFYHYYLLKTDFVIAQRASQNITLTPPIFYVLIGYGFLIIFAILGIYYFFKHKENKKFIFIITWLITNLILLYIPISFQRRFLEGLQIPLVLLTVYSFLYIKNKYFKYILNNKILSLILFVILFCFSNFSNLVRDIYYYNQQIKPFYIKNELKEGINWLKQNNTDKKTVFSNFNEYELSPSFWITSLGNQKTYFSHDHETINYIEKRKTINELLQKKGPSLWNDFYKKNNIGYVFISSQEDDYIFNINNLEQIYSSKSVSIYKTY